MGLAIGVFKAFLGVFIFLMLMWILYFLIVCITDSKRHKAGFDGMLKRVKHAVDISEFLNLPDGLNGFWYTGEINATYSDGQVILNEKDCPYDLEHERGIDQSSKNIFLVFRKGEQVMLYQPDPSMKEHYSLEEYVLQFITPKLQEVPRLQALLAHQRKTQANKASWENKQHVDTILEY